MGHIDLRCRQWMNRSFWPMCGVRTITRCLKHEGFYCGIQVASPILKPKKKEE
uniref:Uncharacterized protein n=1 Tax=uncultured Nitrospirae bacterium MY2-3C TaxID=798577 RepID=D9MP04_9BACT|nr:hypothetical protein LW2_0180 [uncultured Nitrospirae bacterium MY2-3C]